MRQNKNRARIREFVKENPSATVSHITSSLGISSTSVTQHHLTRLRLKGELPEKLSLKVQKALKCKEMLVNATREAIAELEKIINTRD